ncbi:MULTISPECIES: hypothetical protein [Streptomycetaceae]|uniref:hypothetical protein n=1 Tax=Streptomycetaceae TaxID=2062 RepID=UPI000213FE3D|nr:MULTISPECIES: hypothetical protein [Streptomycetaceae]MYS62292.1 hypothetical protein [Streptomyces sp. SID5468]CCB78198.1 conserved protein of unknown function [Streptantibioticus cattleyicolor NRRL 8057 = DSM 46488]
MSNGHPKSDVTVLLTDCAPDDARAVFHTLDARFPADQETGEIRGGPPDHPTVWSATYDAEEAHGSAVGESLNGPVTAEVSGCPHSVRLLTQVLKEAFTVEDAGRVAGDQEVEVCLRLR